MRKLIVTEFVTVDGVMEDPGGSEGMPRGRWALEIDRGAEGDQFKFDEVMQCEAHLLGRKTYEGFASAWPTRSGEFADRINSMPKYVVSNTLKEAGWNNTTLLRGDAAVEVERIKRQPGGSILVAGSRQLVLSLFRHGLVDELRLMVFPVILGQGMRLFENGLPQISLQLSESKVVGDGVLIQIYRPV